MTFYSSLLAEKKKCRQIDCVSLSRCYLLTPDRFETKSADFSWENGQHSPQWWGKGNPRQGKQGGEHPGHAGHHWDHPQLAGHHLCLHLHHLVTLNPPAGWLQLIWTPWEPHWKSPAWPVAADWSQASAIAKRHPLGTASSGGWDHQKLPGSSLLHRRTRPGYLHACDSSMCTVTDTWKAAADTPKTARSLLFPMELFPFQTVYLPHGYLISFSQNVFVSVHICIRFKGTYSSSGCFL